MGYKSSEKAMSSFEAYGVLLLLGLTFLSISTLVFYAANAEAKNVVLDNRPKKKVQLLEPCKDGLNLFVSYRAVQSVAASQPQSVEVRLSPGGLGEVRKVEKKQKSKVTPAACAAWQEFAWPAVDRIIAQSKSKERRGFECINAADIRYKVGPSRQRAARVCLGDASQDGLTRAFYEFWDQTGALGK